MHQPLTYLDSQFAKIKRPRPLSTPKAITQAKLRMITLYHNPRCSKSRAALDLLVTTYNRTDEPIEIIEYLKQPLTVEQLQTLRRQLGSPVRDMLREPEVEYRELNLANPALSDAQLYQAIVDHPILLQRPVVVRNGRAVIGRPPENIEALFA